MNEIKDCIDALLAAVQNSEEYQEFEKYRDLLKENPELMGRVNAFTYEAAYERTSTYMQVGVCYL